MALRWYRVAAEKGDKTSQFQIGLMYQTGQGVEANAEEAHRWFTAHLKHHLHHEHDPKMQAWRSRRWSSSTSGIAARPWPPIGGTVIRCWPT